jgi:hypothetical protein
MGNGSGMVVGQSTSTAGAAGWLAGSQFGSVSLQYVGAGMFSVLSQQGTLEVH